MKGTQSSVEELLRNIDGISSELTDLKTDMLEFVQPRKASKPARVRPSLPASSTAVTVSTATRSGSPHRGAAGRGVADSLLERQRESKARLEAKRAAKREAEMAEVKSKPSINAKSRALAQRRGGAGHIAARGQAALAAKAEKAAKMRAALREREEAELRSRPTINATSRRLARGGGGVSRMMAWQEARDAKVAAKRQAKEAAAAASLKPEVTASKHSKRILAMKGGQEHGDAASRLYSLGVAQQQGRGEAGHRSPSSQRPPGRARSAPRQGPSIYERSKVASAAKEARLAARRKEGEQAQQRSRSAARRQGSSGRAASGGRGRAASPAPTTDAVRSKLFAGRASSAPRQRRAQEGGAGGGAGARTAPRTLRSQYRFGQGRADTHLAPTSRGEASHAASPAPAAPKHGVALGQGWYQYVDKDSGQAYFFHKASGEVTWSRPDSLDPPASRIPQPSPSTADAAWAQQAGGSFASRFAQVAASLAQA